VVVLEGQEIIKRFGGLLALAHVDFQIQADEVVGLICPNGCGKTTLAFGVGPSLSGHSPFP
jgi:ABC-type branched-subunit amino acid transport system ATPase component